LDASLAGLKFKDSDALPQVHRLRPIDDRKLLTRAYARLAHG
jgi:hypothetical protein